MGGGRAVFRVICCVRARQQNKNDADKSKREEISRPETSGTTQQKSSSAFYPYGAGANLLDWSHSLIPDCIIFRTVCTFSWQPHPLTLIECFKPGFLCFANRKRVSFAVVRWFCVCLKFLIPFGSLFAAWKHFARKTILGASVERGSELQ